MARVWEWTLEDASLVRVSIRGFGKLTVEANGQQVAQGRTGMGIKTLTFEVQGKLPAVLTYGAQAGIDFKCELHVDGTLVLPSKAPRGAVRALTACPHCAAALTPSDKFCDACGKPLPSPEQLQLEAQVRSGNSTVGALSALFVVAGGIMYAVQRAAANEALTNMAGLDADAPLAQPIAGVASTIGELRNQLEWETWSVLLINGVLAVIMLGLWRWGKHKPSAAITVAFCTYLVVLVVNGALDPKTIGQGIFVKIVVLVYLVRGLKAALALRSMKARA